MLCLSSRKLFLVHLTQTVFIAFALESVTRSEIPLGRGFVVCFRHVFLTLSDHGAEDH